MTYIGKYTCHLLLPRFIFLGYTSFKKSFFYSFITEIIGLQYFYNIFSFIPYSWHQLTVSDLKPGMQLSCVANDFINGGVIFFRPYFINWRDFPVIQPQKLENFIDKNFSLGCLSQYMKSHMDFTILQFFKVLMKFSDIFWKRLVLIIRYFPV